MIVTRDGKNFTSKEGVISAEGHAFDFRADGNNVVRVYLTGNYYNFGSAKNINNTIPITLSASLTLYQVIGDSNTRFYVLVGQHTDGYSIANIIGQDANGRFISYVKDTTLGKYGFDSTAGRCDVSVDGDTVLLTFSNGWHQKHQFLLKWDDNAQWFEIDSQAL